MSHSQAVFAQSILDAEHLLQHFNHFNSHKLPPSEIEVLKRAGLIMAMTAWETYVEDRVQECLIKRLSGLTNSAIGALVQAKLDEEIKRLHNPTSAKTIQLFNDYAGVDVSTSWKWANFDPKNAQEKLNEYIKLRGDIVHRSRGLLTGPTPAHPVSKEDLERVIRFLKNLVESTEKALIKNNNAET